MTYSLAGRCARTGMLGGVITTSSAAVGSRCLHARAGVGVVLTQHRTDPRLGPRGLALLQGGCDPAHAVSALVASTPDAGWRQLAVLDRHGAGALFSGANIQSRHAAVAGADCVAAGNILRSEDVPAAMVAAFTAQDALDLPERLLAALAAGHAAGGEERPVRSAALLVVREQSFAFVDLRVDDSADPINALASLWQVYKPEAEEYVTRALHPDRSGPTI